jgi:hypothetical protein
MMGLLVCFGLSFAGVLIGYTCYRYGRAAAYLAARHHLAATGRLPIELQTPPRQTTPAATAQQMRASLPPVATPRPAKRQTVEPGEQYDRCAVVFLCSLWVVFAMLMAFHLVKAVAG